MAQDKDTLDRTVAFLQKRDGTDKLLKILRYSVKLLLATNFLSSTSESRKRLKNFETSVGVSRKALRLGKFLQDINDLRRAPSLATLEGILELIASGGEGIYYFVEQFIWLVKAGAIDKSHGPRLTKLSALFELIGYTGSITLTAMQITSLLQKEQFMLRRGRSPQLLTDSSDTSVKSESEQQVMTTEDTAALRALRFKRVLKTLALIQDVSDSFLAITDILDEDKQPRWLKSAVFLAATGLLSAAISAHKNWVTLP